MRGAIDVLPSFWPQITATATVLFQLATAAHAILYKRDSRAAVAWVGLIWLSPIIGSVLYILLGVNRVRRRAAGMRGPESEHVPSLERWLCAPPELLERLPDDRAHLLEMSRLGLRLTELPLLRGNRVEPLIDGDVAYPAMLEAIESARESITLTIYIFSNDATGRRFVDALARAVERGVEVRVLIDAVGARYSRRSIKGLLRGRGIPTATFMSSLFLWRMPFFNLRSHRKIMVIDGYIGFTGGMNIRGECVLADRPSHPTRDLHFRVTGPVVEQLQATFVEDWNFTTGELLAGEKWFPSEREATGTVLARAIPDGPDHDMDKMSMAFQGALSVARYSVRIVTPYFLPDRSLVAALNTCALRGVTVDVLLPSENNLRMVSWAATAQLWQVLEWGCRVWYSPPPFDHSKLMTVDGALAIIGSSNWDSRSLRLNFELGMECYDTELVSVLDQEIEARVSVAREVTLREVNGRSFPAKLRDGTVRLFAPYL